MRRIVGVGVAALRPGLAAAGPAAASYPVPDPFSAGVTAQAQSPNAPPPGANDFSCQPSAAHPQPVVLVHGWIANQTDNWQTISPILANNGYCVFSLTYGTDPNVSTPVYQPGGLIPMQESAQQLADFVDEVLDATHASKVNIVGHSEGSLMPNWYVKYLGGAAKVKRYVGITTLWHGTDPVGLATIQQIGQRPRRPAGALLRDRRVVCRVPAVPHGLRTSSSRCARRHRCSRRDVHEHRHAQRRAGLAIHERDRVRTEDHELRRPGPVPPGPGGAHLGRRRPDRRAGRPQRARSVTPTTGSVQTCTAVRRSPAVHRNAVTPDP